LKLKNVCSTRASVKKTGKSQRSGLGIRTIPELKKECTLWSEEESDQLGLYQWVQRVKPHELYF